MLSCDDHCAIGLFSQRDQPQDTIKEEDRKVVEMMMKSHGMLMPTGDNWASEAAIKLQVQFGHQWRDMSSTQTSVTHCAADIVNK